MKCPACGAENDEDAKFCNLCLTSFRQGNKPTLEQLADKPSVSPNYLSNAKEPDIRRLWKYSGWVTRIGCAIICLIVIIPLAVIFLPPVISGLAEIGTDCQRIDDKSFQSEVLQSPLPVLVYFTSEEQWNMKMNTPAGFGLFMDPSPVTLALREIIKDGKYKDKVKFYKYYMSVPPNDTLSAKYKIEGYTTIIIFKNGDIFWQDKGPNWCVVKDEMIEQAKQKIEGILIEVSKN
jgi:hypothetical protein